MARRSAEGTHPQSLRGRLQAKRDKGATRPLFGFGCFPSPEGGASVELSRVDLQDLADQFQAKGLDPSTIQTTLMPLRAIYKRAVAKGQVLVNPTTGLVLPAVRSKRDRIASPKEAAQLIGACALPAEDRALWARPCTPVCAAELMALRWEDVDLTAGLIRVERSWDTKEGEIDPKSAVGRRTVPIPSVLRTYLQEQRIRASDPDGRVFGNGSQPFSPSRVRARAAKAWESLEPITLHEARRSGHSELPRFYSGR